MSSSPLTDTSSLLRELGRPKLSTFVVRPVRRIAFWAAIVLPFLYLPLLAAGLESQSMVLAFVALLVSNAVAIYVGHPDALE